MSRRARTLSVRWRRWFTLSLAVFSLFGLAGETLIHTLCHVSHVHCTCGGAGCGAPEGAASLRARCVGGRDALFAGEIHCDHTCLLCAAGAGLGTELPPVPIIVAGSDSSPLPPPAAEVFRLYLIRSPSARAPPGAPFA